MQISDFPILLVGGDSHQVTLVREAFARANLVNPLCTVSGRKELTEYLSGREPYQNRKEHPLPSLILVDYEDAGSDWVEVLEGVRRQPALAAVSIAVLSAGMSPQDRHHAQRLGVGCFLPKPVDTESLLQMMVSTGMYWAILRKNKEADLGRGAESAALAAGSLAAPAYSTSSLPRRQSGRQDTEILGDQIRFQKTSWDLVRSAEHSRGMDILIRIYWKPLYFFVRQKGFDNETAKDIVQDFLADALERGTISRADPARGKFRTFLLRALCNFIQDWHKSSNRLKRGGGHVTLSLDFDVGEQQYAVEIASGETPDTILDRAWLQSVLEECIAELTGNATHLEAFRLMIQGSSYAQIAKETRLSESAVKAAVFRLRQQLRDIVLRRVQGSGDEGGGEELDLSQLSALLR